MAPALILELAVFLAVQAGSLIYFAGQVKATLHSHEERITKTETSVASLAEIAAYIKGVERITL